MLWEVFPHVLPLFVFPCTAWVCCIHLLARTVGSSPIHKIFFYIEWGNDAKAGCSCKMSSIMLESCKMSTFTSHTSAASHCELGESLNFSSLGCSEPSGNVSVQVNFLKEKEKWVVLLSENCREQQAPEAVVLERLAISGTISIGGIGVLQSMRRSWWEE